MENAINTEKVKAFIQQILEQQAPSKSMDWLMLQKEKISQESSYLKFYLAFGQASRYFKKTPNFLTEEQQVEANALLVGFSPQYWDQLQTARTFLLLQFRELDEDTWVKTLSKLFETADMYEQQALYAALPVMPFQESMVGRAIEGLRTNISSIFDAIALNNPYPAHYFEERAWNQMVLKAVFMQRPLYQIQKADERSNQQLAAILVDFAHERWAAGREVMPELWRFVGPFLSSDHMQDIEKIISSGDSLQIQAAVLACSNSNLPEALELVEVHPVIQIKINEGSVTWERIGMEFQHQSN